MLLCCVLLTAPTTTASCGEQYCCICACCAMLVAKQLGQLTSYYRQHLYCSSKSRSGSQPAL
jgi:hypothetical protein